MEDMEVSYKVKLFRCSGLVTSEEADKQEAGKEPDMDTNEQACRYIRNETCDTERKAYDKLRVKYKIDEDPPTGGKELVDRILAGRYQLPKVEFNEDFEYHTYGIIWRTPGEVPDRDGFQAATDALVLEKRKVNDAATILEPAVALDALNGFRAYVDAL